jgi:hypothetical protein
MFIFQEKTQYVWNFIPIYILTLAGHPAGLDCLQKGKISSCTSHESNFDSLVVHSVVHRVSYLRDP